MHRVELSSTSRAELDEYGGNRHAAMNALDEENERPPEQPLPPHYYVRGFFILGVLIMLVMLPFLRAEIPIPVYASLFIIIIVGIAAGLTSPRWRWIAVSDTLIAVIGVVVFEYYAVLSYPERAERGLFFWTNHILAITFLVALYYAAKTLRGMRRA